MRNKIVLLIFCLMILTTNNLSLTNTISYAQQSDEEIVIKLDKRLQYNNLSDAKAELTTQLLIPPINLGAKRDEVKRKLGMPKEVYGFGTEFYKVKNANLTISYTTDEKGDVVVNNLEFRPNKEILWANWLKPLVKLPAPPATYDKKSKTPIRITTQVRINDVGNNKSWQITLIGNQTAVTYVSWNIVL